MHFICGSGPIVYVTLIPLFFQGFDNNGVIIGPRSTRQSNPEEHANLYFNTYSKDMLVQVSFKQKAFWPSSFLAAMLRVPILILLQTTKRHVLQFLQGPLEAVTILCSFLDLKSPTLHLK